MGKQNQRLKVTRKSWDEYFLDLAEKASERATCDRLHVGCIIVKNKKVISTGYNGSPPDSPHCDDVGHLYNEAGRCIRTIHAEQNAILMAEKDCTGATAYVTHEPCETCTKLLRGKGIIRVVFRHAYNNKYNKEFIGNMQWEHHPKKVYTKIVISKTMTLNEIQGSNAVEILKQRKRGIRDIVVSINNYRDLSKQNAKDCFYIQTEESLIIELHRESEILYSDIYRIAHNAGLTLHNYHKKSIEELI